MEVKVAGPGKKPLDLRIFLLSRDYPLGKRNLNASLATMAGLPTRTSGAEVEKQSSARTRSRTRDPQVADPAIHPPDLPTDSVPASPKGKKTSK